MSTLDLAALDAALDASRRRHETVAAKRDAVVRAAEDWANKATSDAALFSAVASLRAARRASRSTP